MQNTDKFKQHVVNQLSRYVRDLRKNVGKYHESIHDMILEDADYAETILEQYKQSNDWNELRENLFNQDTLPREECCYYLIEDDETTARSVGLTWSWLNKI